MSADTGMTGFERYLTLWVFVCIVLGMALGQVFPGVFQAIGSIEVAALLREDGPNTFKLSLRSRGNFEVLSLAE